MTVLLALLAAAVAVPLALALPPVAAAWWALPDGPRFGLGALGGAIGAMVVLRRAPMLAILEHELTHLLVALLLLRRPIGLSAGDGGGETVYGGRGSTLIRLAPYVLPTFTLLLLPLLLVAHGGARPSIVAALGTTWGYHVWTALHETRPHQPDLRRGGLIASYAAVLSLGLVLYGGTAVAAVGRWPLLRRWLWGGWSEAARLWALLTG